MERFGPNMEQMTLEALTHFAAIARHGGLSAAARATGVPKATLSRHLRALEHDLGADLVLRGPRALRLTEEGRALYERTAPHLAALLAAGAELRGGRGAVRGVLRISVPALLARFGIAAFATDFLRHHPEVTLEIDVDDRFVDPLRDGYDLVIRANPGPESELVGRLFLRTRGIVAAVPDLPLPEAPEAEVPAVVLSSRPASEIWTLLFEGEERRLRPRPVVRSSSMLLVHEAVLAGAGAGILPLSLVAQDLEAGRLVSWGQIGEAAIGAWVLHPPGHLVRPAVRAFVEEMTRFFRADTAE
ncbi:DNA-binding transcriptional LysR family regulator [Rhodobacter viridis]|uniref:DNA-binding transcriptional LysR family regulator n=2 Tax=Rhodobacter viridis TaxID=1054202 RepID=A0A318UDG4_9RHOB|nr:DNA-binding transcriptional LysR family regulator [Rhodobacter viridis]